MNARVTELRERSLATPPSISAERALLLTRFYRENLGRHSTPVLRRSPSASLCERKTITIGPDELIVGERGPAPKATPTYPELTCHSDRGPADPRQPREDQLRRPAGVDRRLRGRGHPVLARPEPAGPHLRDLPPEWHDAYEAGMFTEFMEQRAPGHTVADGKIYAKGHGRFQGRHRRARAAAWTSAPIRRRRARPRSSGRWTSRPTPTILFAERHAELAASHGGRASATQRGARSSSASPRSAAASPPHAPRDFWEALQMYWFCHLARDHGAQRLGLLLAGPPRPAPRAVLPARDRATAR